MEGNNKDSKFINSKSELLVISFMVGFGILVAILTLMDLAEMI